MSKDATNNLVQKLRQTLFDNNMRSRELAKKLNLSDATLHRLLHGKSVRPYKASLTSIAKYLDMKVDDLYAPNENTNPTYDYKNFKEIPILTLDILDHFIKAEYQMSKLTSALNGKHEISPTKTIMIQNQSDKLVALAIDDFSMDPMLKRSDIAIFDANPKIQDRDYALIKIAKHNTYLVRQIIIADNEVFMSSLNPIDGTPNVKKVFPKDIIIAKLIEVRKHL